MDAEKNSLGTCDRFNGLCWHDSKLLGAQIVRSRDGRNDELCLDVRLRVGPDGTGWKKATVRLTECTLVMVDLDLAGKRVCSDSIAVGYCEKDSALKERIRRERLPREPHALAAFFHFCVSLVPPGGEINAFAKDFELLIE
jgi:hypothetical protein